MERILEKIKRPKSIKASPEQEMLQDVLKCIPWPKSQNDATWPETLKKRISKVIRDHWSLQQQIRKDLENDISDCQKLLRDKEYQHAQEVSKLETRHGTDMRDLKGAHLRELTEVKVQSERQRRELEFLEGKLNAAEREKQHAQAWHEARMQSLHEDHAAELQTLRKKHEVEVRSLQRESDRRVQELQVECEAKLQSMQSEHGARMGSLQDRHEAALRSSREDMDKERDDHKATLESLREEMDRRSEAYTAALDLREHEHAREQARLHQEATKREESLLSSHKQEMQYLRIQVKELNAALLERDDELYTSKLFSTSGLPQMSDGKLKDSFAKITAAVDYLGRVEWRSDQSLVPDVDFNRRRGSHQIKKVQKAVIHDIIWCLLFEFVFASPFRMFGELGRTFEAQWVVHSGTDVQTDADTFKWPPPSAQTERWRYMTLAKCREALTQPVSGFDPRAQIKKAFSDTQEALVHELKTAIGSVTVLDTETLRRIEELPRLTRITWLDFQMHRCRIMARLTGSGTTRPSGRPEAICRGPVTLTILPDLRRFGNIKGTDLDTAVMIQGCDGETLGLS